MATRATMVPPSRPASSGAVATAIATAQHTARGGGATRPGAKRPSGPATAATMSSTNAPPAVSCRDRGSWPARRLESGVDLHGEPAVAGSRRWPGPDGPSGPELVAVRRSGVDHPQLEDASVAVVARQEGAEVVQLTRPAPRLDLDHRQ